MLELKLKAGQALSMLGIEGMDYAKLRRELGLRDVTGALECTPYDIMKIKRKMVDGFAEWQDNTKEPVKYIVSRITKGGQGKTTLAVNLAVSMAQRGLRCLLVDFDPQSSATELLGHDPESAYIKTAVDVILNNIPLNDALLRISEDAELFLLPADQVLASFDARVMASMGRENTLKKYLAAHAEEISSRFDFVIIDTGPGHSLLAINALFASDLILTPLAADGLSLKALSMLTTELEEVRALSGKEHPVYFVFNNVNRTYGHILENIENLRAQFGSFISPTEIPTSISVSRQVTAQQTLPTVVSEPKKPAGEALQNVAVEVLFKLGVPGMAYAMAEQERKMKESEAKNV